MKKWLRKTSPSPSSYALPISWVSKFKKQRESPGKEKKQASRSDSKDSAVAAEHQLGSQDKWQKVEDAEARKATSVRNEKELQMSKSIDIGGGSRERSEHKKKEVRAEGLESFAVAKHSQDPRQDFRDSMMDMIAEMGIKKPEKMEELLASYLTLNADEYHDLIIQVFKQVWHELDDMRILNLQLQQLSLVFDN